MEVPTDGPNAPRSNNAKTVALLQDTFDVTTLNLSASPRDQIPVSLNGALNLNMNEQPANPSRGANASAASTVDVQVPFSIVLRVWLCEADSPCASQPFDSVAPKADARSLGYIAMPSTAMDKLLDLIGSQAQVSNPGQVLLFIVRRIVEKHVCILNR